MKTIEIKLSGVKVYERMSEETTAFDAFVLINGIKAAYAKNDGQGGNTFVHVIDSKHRQLLNDAEEYCKTLPPCTFELDGKVHEYANDLENVIDNLVLDYQRTQDEVKHKRKIEKLCLNAIVFGSATEYAYMKFTQPIAYYLQTERGKAFIKEQYQKITDKHLKAGDKIFNTNIPL